MSLSTHVRTPLRRTLGVLAAAMAFVIALPLAAHAAYSTTADDTARVNGKVFAIAPAGATTYIGGAFTAVGGQTRQGVAAIKADGRLGSGFAANVANADGTPGVVNAIAVSGSTVFIGGKFATVNGEPRANLAAVDATSGAVLPTWSADTTGITPEVLSLAVSGGTLFVGGRFGGIDGGTAKKRLAAVGVSSGNVIKSFSPAPNLAAVKFLAPNPNGQTLFVGGAFDVIGGASRPSGIAELSIANPSDPATYGKVTPFNPNFSGSTVTAMGIAPDASVLYFGVANNQVFAHRVSDSGLLWTVKNGGDTQAIASDGTEVFLGGHFGNNLTEKVKRQWVESVNADTGKLTAWDAKLGGGSMGVWAIALTDTHVHIGGEFVTVNGLNKPRYVRFAKQG